MDTLKIKLILLVLCSFIILNCTFPVFGDCPSSDIGDIFINKEKVPTHRPNAPSRWKITYSFVNNVIVFHIPYDIGDIPVSVQNSDNRIEDTVSYNQPIFYICELSGVCMITYTLPNGANHTDTIII